MMFSMQSNSYKLVRREEKVIIAAGSAAAMRKLRRQDPDHLVVYLAPSKKIGETVK